MINYDHEADRRRMLNRLREATRLVQRGELGAASQLVGGDT